MCIIIILLLAIRMQVMDACVWVLFTFCFQFYFSSSHCFVGFDAWDVKRGFDLSFLSPTDFVPYDLRLSLRVPPFVTKFALSSRRRQTTQYIIRAACS